MTMPTTPMTIVHQAMPARTKPGLRIWNPTSPSTQKPMPMTAKAAQATKAPKPWAVMIA